MKLKISEFFDALEKELPRIVCILGSEEFLRREAVAAIQEKIHGSRPEADTDRPDDENALCIHAPSSPSESELTALFDDIRTPSLFGGERTLVVHGADRFLKLDPDVWLKILDGGWTGTTVVLTMEELDGRTKVARALDRSGWVVQVAKPFHRPPPWQPRARPWENDLNRWIITRARRAGLKLDPPGAHRIQTRVGTDLGNLAATIERISTVLPDGGRVTSELIDDHTPEGEESTLFELVDIFYLRHRAESLRLAREILHRGSIDARGTRTSEASSLLLQFVGAALRRGRQLRELHASEARRESEAELLSRLGIRRPFLPRLQQQARATRPGTLTGIVQELRRADQHLKEGRGALPGELLERIMVKPY